MIDSFESSAIPQTIKETAFQFLFESLVEFVEREKLMLFFMCEDEKHLTNLCIGLFFSRFGMQPIYDFFAWDASFEIIPKKYCVLLLYRAVVMLGKYYADGDAEDPSGYFRQNYKSYLHDG